MHLSNGLLALPRPVKQAQRQEVLVFRRSRKKAKEMLRGQIAVVELIHAHRSMCTVLQNRGLQNDVKMSKGYLETAAKYKLYRNTLQNQT